MSCKGEEGAKEKQENKQRREEKNILQEKNSRGQGSEGNRRKTRSWTTVDVEARDNYWLETRRLRPIGGDWGELALEGELLQSASTCECWVVWRGLWQGGGGEGRQLMCSSCLVRTLSGFMGEGKNGRMAEVSGGPHLGERSGEKQQEDERWRERKGCKGHWGK